MWVIYHLHLVFKCSKSIDLSTSETTVLCCFLSILADILKGKSRCMVVVSGVVWCQNDINQGADMLHEHAHFQEVPRSFRWLVLTRNCADDLITSSVCLWIYSLDHVISLCPQQGWTTHLAFFCAILWISVQKMETAFIPKKAVISINMQTSFSVASSSNDTQSD